MCGAGAFGLNSEGFVSGYAFRNAASSPHPLQPQSDERMQPTASPMRDRQTPTAPAYLLQDTRIACLSLRKNIVILVVLVLDLLSLTRHFICVFFQPLVDGGLLRATFV